MLSQYRNSTGDVSSEDIQIISIPLGPLQSNCIFLVDPHSKDGYIIDPGDEADYLASFVAEKGIHLKKIWITHAHIDHVGAVMYVSELLSQRYGFEPEISMHPEDEFLYKTIENQAMMIGIPYDPRYRIDHAFTDGEKFNLGNMEITVIHTPGHSPGSVSFHIQNRNRTESYLIAGDTLFYGSIGRTDLPGGSYKALENSVRNKLYTLPDSTIVYCGHGPTTTISQEKRSNSFIRA